MKYPLRVINCWSNAYLSVSRSNKLFERLYSVLATRTFCPVIFFANIVCARTSILIVKKKGPNDDIE